MIENYSKLCQFCNKNIDLAEHDKQIRAEVIDECKKTIQKMFEYIGSEGLPHYALYAYINLISISNTLEQLKEQK